MKTMVIAAALMLVAGLAQAQTSPGGQFLQNWDLDGNGTATLEELREMRGLVFTSFDSNQDDHLDADEYVTFNEARANDVANYDGPQRAEMKAVADGMRLTANDANRDGKVSRHEFIAAVDAWFKALDRNADGGVTLADFGSR